MLRRFFKPRPKYRLVAHRNNGTISMCTVTSKLYTDYNKAKRDAEILLSERHGRNRVKFDSIEVGEEHVYPIPGYTIIDNKTKRIIEYTKF